MAEETTHIQDALLPAFEMNVKLNVFEGPLDLLLFLIRKNEIDIYDIPIAEVTSQYMGVLRAMKNLSLEVAGEFFVMAATLMYIKSRMLLPSDERPVQTSDEDEDSDIDPRWQLVEQLLEYKKIKQASLAIGDMIDNRQNFGERRVFDKDMVKSERPLCRSDKIEMWTTFNLILRRLAEKLMEGTITGENVTIADRMEYILSIKEKSFTFTSLFKGEKTALQTIIATFLALLELTRMRRLRLTQNVAFDEIFCETLDPETLPPSEKFAGADFSGDENPDDNDSLHTSENGDSQESDKRGVEMSDVNKRAAEDAQGKEKESPQE